MNDKINKKSKISKDARSASPRKGRKRKMRRPLNRYESAKDDSVTSTSAKRLKAANDLEVNIHDNVDYVILNFVTVFSFISDTLKCKTCDGEVQIFKYAPCGLGFKIKILCRRCEPRFVTSCPYNGKTYDINMRFFFVMRILGIGFKGAQRFCGLMDLAIPAAQQTYDAIVQNIHIAAKAVCDLVLRRSAAAEKEETAKATDDRNLKGLTVSGGGTWRKRGFDSLYGVSSVIGYYTGKVLDINIKSAYCQACKIWEHKRTTAECESWAEEHKDHCQVNQGSSEKMEIEAIREIFLRSEDLHGVKYINYIGDSDSETYKGIVDGAPYDDVVKKECIERLQKRMGRRLQDCKRSQADLGDEDKLTAVSIDKLTTYYGLAIGRNCHSVEEMRKAIWAIFYHFISTDEQPQHHDCPRGADSWCDWQCANAANTLHEYRHGRALHDALATAIKPIYTDLSSDDLLERCVGGFAQSNNESLHNLVWDVAPEITDSDARIMEIAAFVAASIFNEGNKSCLQILDTLGVCIGRNSHQYCENEDAGRIAEAERKAFQTLREKKIRLQFEESAAEVIHIKEKNDQE